MHFTNELENYNIFNEVHLDLNLRVCHQNKPSVLFVGHRQTEQTQIRCCRTQRLIRVSTAYLQNVLLKFEKKKMKNFTQQPLKRIWTGPIDKSGIFHKA